MIKLFVQSGDTLPPDSKRTHPGWWEGICEARNWPLTEKGLDAESQGFDQGEWWEHEKRQVCHLQTPRNDGRDTSATKWHKKLVWYWAFVFLQHVPCALETTICEATNQTWTLLFVASPAGYTGALGACEKAAQTPATWGRSDLLDSTQIPVVLGLAGEERRKWDLRHLRHLSLIAWICSNFWT